MISHIVLFNPKADISSEKKRSFALSIQDTCRSIPNVRRALVGHSVAIDPGYPRQFGEKTYEFAAVIEFDTEDDLREYLRHPLHRELGRLFWETCQSTVVVEMRMFDAKLDGAADFLVK